MATMSVRGTMTSRARVSPSSKTEWIISRSPASMSAESRAMSTRSRSSLSLSNGPSRNPFPGVTAFVSAMRSRLNGPRTRRSHTVAGAAASATRVLCCTPSVPGETPTTAKEISAMIPIATRNGCTGAVDPLDDGEGHHDGDRRLGDDAQEGQHREVGRGVPDDAHERLRARPPLVEELVGAGARHPLEGRLGGGDEERDEGGDDRQGDEPGHGWESSWLRRSAGHGWRGR